MNETHILTPYGARFDYQAVDDGKVATVELKRGDSAITSYWWVTGLNAAGELVNLYQMQLALPSLPEESINLLIEAMLKDYAFPLAHIASRTKGHQEVVQIFDPRFREKLALAHLEIHDELENLGDSSDSVLTRSARQYQLVESLGVGKLVEVLATFEGVSIHTMRRRLERARNEGLIAKRRDEKSITKGAAHKPIN